MLYVIAVENFRKLKIGKYSTARQSELLVREVYYGGLRV